MTITSKTAGGVSGWKRGVRSGAMLSALLPATAMAHAPTPVASMDASLRPAAVPADYVVTPSGYFHPSCVQELQDSEQLREDGSILRANGSIRAVAACQHAAFLRDGTRVEPNDESNKMVRQPVTYNGYLQLVYTVLGSGANELTATMTVPPNPSEIASQTVYFFPGLEDIENVVTILQPVLGWNAFSGKQWTISAWNCCKSGSIYVGSRKPVVKPGDVIFGKMINTSGKWWTITAKDQTQPFLPTATLRTQNWGQTFDWIFAGALETYDVSSCSQFPASGPVEFANINTYVGGKLISNPSWSIQSGAGSPSSCTSASVVNSTTVDINY